MRVRLVGIVPRILPKWSWPRRADCARARSNQAPARRAEHRSVKRGPVRENRESAAAIYRNKAERWPLEFVEA